MIKELIAALEARNQDEHKFDPEIKVRRDKDTLYISQIRKTKVNYMATVEVFRNKGRNDKAPIPLGALDDFSLKQILQRIN